jgi:hypothetical protein
MFCNRADQLMLGTDRKALGGGLKLLNWGCISGHTNFGLIFKMSEANRKLYYSPQLRRVNDFGLSN